ncbi:MAG: hypothetical protein KDE35_03700 [Geminicoccaceae bacterium]|nr:hypothetical protein [Geminicoccaceae bacterium]
MTTQMPKFDMPKMDLEGFFAMHKANLDTMIEAQAVMVDAGQQIARMQFAWFEDSMKMGRAALEGDAREKKPADMLAEVKSVTEKAMKVAKDEADLGLKAQQKVADLVAKRMSVNMQQVKSLVAA